MMCKMVRPQNLAKYYEVNQKLNFFDYIYIFINYTIITQFTTLGFFFISKKKKKYS